jgi:hypothetical protein
MKKLSNKEMNLLIGGTSQSSSTSDDDYIIVIIGGVPVKIKPTRLTL